MTALATSVLERSGEQVGRALPQIALALAVLIVGLIVTRYAGRLVARLLLKAGADRFGEAFGVHAVLARAGLERSLSRLAGFAIKVAIAVAAVLAALSLSGLAFLQESLNQGVLFLPKIIAALALVLAGLVLGGLARERVDRAAYQMDLRGPLGAVAQSAVIAIFLIVALAEVGIPTGLLVVLAAIVAGGTALTFALAFGLGSSHLARSVSAGRYVSASFRVGQRVELAVAAGEIVAIESASTVLRADDGRTLRVPNHLFLEGVAVVDGGP